MSNLRKKDYWKCDFCGKEAQSLAVIYPRNKTAPFNNDEVKERCKDCTKKGVTIPILK